MIFWIYFINDYKLYFSEYYTHLTQIVATKYVF